MTSSGTTRLLITILLFLILEAGSLFMVVNDGPFQKARVSGVLFNIFSSIDRLSSEVKYFFSLNEVIVYYQEENQRLEKDVSKYRALAEMHASSVLDTTKTYIYEENRDRDIDSIFTFIPANVVTNSTNKLHNHIIIDKGRKAGIEPDMGVITQNGVVGIISSVSENYSFVKSLLDIDQKLSARILPSNAAGTVSWEGKSPRFVSLTEIPLHIAFNKSDTVYTSGFSSIFPADIPIGCVESSFQTQGTHHKIEVKLFQDFSTLRFVSIVKNIRRSEIDSLIHVANEQQ